MKYLLAAMAHSDTERFDATFSGDEGPTALRRLWGQLGRRLDPQDRVPADGIDLCWDEHGPDEALLMTLPTACLPGEAHYLMILPTDPPRVFALEATLPFAGGTNTCLVSLGMNQRANYGPGPAPSLRGFADAVWSLLHTERRPVLVAESGNPYA